MDTLNSAKFTSKMIETHLRCVLLFSVMIDAPAYLTGHLISPKTQYKFSGSIC